MATTLSDLSTAISEYFPTIVKRIESQSELKLALEDAIAALSDRAFSWARLNQIMHLCSQAGMSEGFFRYYFLEVPKAHPYPTEKVFDSAGYKPPSSGSEIATLRQFQWGVRRFIYDAMLYWGNFRQAYRDLRQMSFEQITSHFAQRRFDENHLITRGKVRGPVSIPKDHRYLISEMACKTYDSSTTLAGMPHVKLALQAFSNLRERGVAVTPALLKEATESLAKTDGQMQLFDLLYEDTSVPHIQSPEEVVALYTGQWSAFKAARAAALENTRIYLSFCNDLDIYVATSMRGRQDFRDMATTSERIMQSDRLEKYKLRFFDPTLSASDSHEDKGIIECLMVKTAKALIYFAQHKESLGKVSEYAMALTLGKSVIILCPDDARGKELYAFYKDSHPLTRLIEFSTGIVNGAIITTNLDYVINIVDRLFSNAMEYDLSRKEGHEGYYLLKERLTGSTVRVVSDDRLLVETFWNNYHRIQ